MALSEDLTEVVGTEVEAEHLVVAAVADVVVEDGGAGTDGSHDYFRANTHPAFSTRIKNKKFYL